MHKFWRLALIPYQKIEETEQLCVLHNINQRNAHLTKLIFQFFFWHLSHVSNPSVHLQADIFTNTKVRS